MTPIAVAAGSLAAAATIAIGVAASADGPAPGLVGAAGVALLGLALAARRPVGPAMTDAEAANLDRHAFGGGRWWPGQRRLRARRTAFGRIVASGRANFVFVK